jgi:transcriptional regulator with XRE-family HTH domain
MIRLLATASIFACVLAAGMAPAAAASTEDAPGTALPAAEDPLPVEAGEEPAAHPTPQDEPPPKKPPPDDEDPGSEETIEPEPTDSLSTEPPPGDTTGTASDGEPGPPSDGVEDATSDDAAPPADAPPADAPPADSPPGEVPAAEPPRVVVEGIAPEPPGVALVASDVAATGPAVNAPSAPKPAERPRSAGPSPSAPQAADPPAADADPGTDALARTRRPDPSPDTRFDRAAAAGAGLMAGLAVTGRAHATIAVAVEFGRAGGGWAGALVFNLWLRRQLRERRMSQRQLAALSGVDHSTISRLLSEDRRPSLATATKLVAAFGHVRGDEAEPAAADYFQRMPEETVFPARRVELALRADEALDEEQIRQLMSMYLNARRRHLAVQERPATMGRLRPTGPPEPASVRRR